MLVVRFEDNAQRAFPDWTMRFVPASSATREILLRSSVDRVFNPYAMSGESALHFLRDMAELPQAVTRQP